MMRIAGTAMIAVSILLIGFVRYEKYKSRPLDLELFIKLISAYRLELKWSRKSFDEIAGSFHYKGYDSYLNEAVSMIGVKSKSEASMDDNSKFALMNLSDDDAAVLRYFFSESGKGSLLSEVTLCEKTLETLEAKKQEAVAEFKKQGPLSLKLGAVCGAWLAIMLL